MILMWKNIYSKNIMKQSIIAGRRSVKLTSCRIIFHWIFRLNLLTLEFTIHAIQLKNQDPFSLPDCYRFAVKVEIFCQKRIFLKRFLFQIVFDNNARTGKIRQRLNSQAHFQTCNTQILNKNSTWPFARRDLLISFDCLVLCVTIVSFILCIRSLWFGHKLAKEVRKYYATERTQEKPLTWGELQAFYSFWYFLMIITDLLVIVGTGIKIIILFKVSLVWIYRLRAAKYFFSSLIRSEMIIMRLVQYLV